MPSSSRRPRILAIIQAGGKGSRMDVLARETPKPLLPFAGAFRLVDFPLSNLRNSGVDDVWLSVQYLAQRVADAVGNGKPWDLDRHQGGFKLIVPQQGAGSAADDGFVSGNAEELLQLRDSITAHGADAVVVMSADHLYRLDYAEVVDEHLGRSAECTIVTTEVALEEAGQHATVVADPDGTVTEVVYKPERPTTGVVATEVFVYDPAVLVEVLEQLQRDLSRTGGDPDTDDDRGDGSALGDFGEHLVPALVGRGRTYAHPMAGYWRDVGRPESYVAAHRDLLSGGDGLFDRDWPILTNSSRHLPARVHAGAEVLDSLLSADCQVSGTVRRSVLGPGVTVAAGASVTDSVLFADVTVAAGARVAWAVVDQGSRVEEDAEVGSPDPAGPDPVGPVRQDRLVLVGPDSRVTAGASVPAGSRLEPGSTA